MANINGSENNDQLNGTPENDLIIGGAGNDQLSGGEGDDIFEFGDVIENTFGSDIIAPSDILEPGVDTIRFLEDVDPAQTRFFRNADELIIIVETFASGNLVELGRVTIENQYFNLTNEALPQVETLIFQADGTSIDLTGGLTFRNGENSFFSEVLGAQGDDTLISLGRNDELFGFAGNDQLIGGEGFDTLRGGTGNDILIGGLGDDDLFGGEGNDSFQFDVDAGEFGFDEIAPSEALEIGDDEIRILGEISEEAIRFFRNSNDNHLNIFVGSFGQIEIENQYFPLTNETVPQVENLVLEATETTIDLTNGLTFTGTENSDSMAGTVFNDVLEGLDGGDSLFGLAGDDQLLGGEGSDFLQGNAGNDTLVGGVGNDDLFGGEGDDIFEFALGNEGGFGFDEIGNNGLEIGSDTIRFLDDINPEETRFFRDGDQLEIYVERVIAGNVVEFGQVVIDNQYSDVSDLPLPQVETFIFAADGTTIDLTNGLTFTGNNNFNTVEGTANDDRLEGLDGGDSLFGLAGDDVLVGGPGSDDLYGGPGNDIFSGTLGQLNNSRIFDFEVGDQIRFEGVSFGQESLSRENFFDNSVQLTIDADNDQVTDTTINLESEFTDSDQFTVSTDADGNTIIILEGAADPPPQNLTLTGDETSNELIGGAGNDIIIGGAGDDRLSGGEGDDRFEFAVGETGFGRNIIADGEILEPGTDTIRFLEDVDPAQTRFFRQDHDLLILVETVASGSVVELGRVTIENQFSNVTNEVLPQVENLLFAADGTAIDLTGGLTFTGTPSGFDTILGAQGDDRLESLAGGDTLLGFAGNDTLVGGEDNDRLEGGFGNDILLGESGDDDLFGGEGNDSFQFDLNAGEFGFDEIGLSNTLEPGTDEIRLLGEISEEDIRFFRDGSGFFSNSNHLNIFVGTFGQIEIENQYFSLTDEVLPQVENLVLETAQTTIDLAGGLNFTGTENSESMAGTVFSDVLEGLAGSDTLLGLAGDDTLLGGEGSDRVEGNAGNDRIVGGEGDDDLFGNEGDDTFEFAVGENGFGFDEINRDGDFESGTDTIRFLADVNPEQTRFFRNSDRLEIFVETVAGGETIELGQIQIYNQYSVATDEAFPQIETLIFEADDSTIDLSGGLTFTGDEGRDRMEGTAQDDVLEGLLGDDDLFGLAGNDILIGGPGSNELYGGPGNDIFLGTLGQLNGDRVFDFSLGDQIRIQGSTFTQSSLSREDFSDNSVRLTIDADNDGVIDTTLDLESEFTDSDRFEVSTDQEGNTNIILVDNSNATPAVENPIDDIVLNQGETPPVINLFEVFEDVEEEDSALTYRAASTNTNLVETNFNPETGELTLNVSSGVGSSQIIVEATDSRGFTGSEFFTVTKEGSEQEPNDIITQATEINSFLTATGEFNVSSLIGDNTALNNPRLDTDLYQLTLNAAESITIDVDTLPTTALDTIIRIFNASGRELAYNDNRPAPGEKGSSDPYLEFTAAASGSYYVGISSAANDQYSPFFAESGLGAGGTGTYQLQIRQGEAGIGDPNVEGESPSNDTLETAITLSLDGEAVSESGQIGDNPDFVTVPGLDVDLYSLELTTGAAIAFSIATATFDTILRLFNANGEEIAFNDDLGGGNSFIQFEAPADGTYYIGVSGFGNDRYDPNFAGSGNNPFARTGSYTLTVTPQALSPIVEAGPGESDDTLETATLIDSNLVTLTRAIGDNPDLAQVGFDVDLYELQLDASSRIAVNINTENLDSNLDSLLRIFDENGNEVAFNDDESDANSDSFLTFSPTIAGTYYVGVSGLGNESYNPNQAGSAEFAGSTGDYEIELSVSAAVTEEVPTNDTQDSAINIDLTNNQFTATGFIGDNFSTVGDVDLYQVSLNGDETLNITVNAAILGSDLDAFLRVFNSNGEEIALDDDSGNFSDPQLSFTAPLTDIYYIGVSAFANRDYDPITGGGSSPGTTGEYELTLELETPVPAAAAPIEEIRPTAENDRGFTNSNNTITIDVLNNDSANDDQGVLEITEFPTTTPKGGSVRLDNQSRIVYTPDPDFAGVDTFTYTIANESGGFDEGTVEVEVNRPPEGASVQITLEVLPVPGLEAQLDDGLQIGDEFLIKVRFQDQLTENNPTQAVTAGYADLLFDPAVIQVVEDNANIDGDDGRVDGILRNAEYNVLRKGSVNNQQGLVNEVGGGAVVLDPDSLPEDNGLFSLHLKAVGGGNTAVLASRAGDENSSTINILGALADQRNQTNFAEVNLAEIVNGNSPVSAFPDAISLQEQEVAGVAAAIEAMSINVNFRDLDGNPLGEVAVGDEFEIVLSARDLRLDGGELGNKLGVFSAFADVLYDTVLIDVTDVRLNEPFTSPVLSLDNAIDEGEGIVNELGGSNSEFTPVTETQDFAILSATATAAGELRVQTNAGDAPTSINTLFGVDSNLNSGTIFGENTLEIVGEASTGNADLVVTEFDAIIDHVLGGETEISVTVKNQGEGNASGFQLEVLYYRADNLDELASESPLVVETLALGELPAGETTNTTQALSLPLDVLLAEALEDDPSIFGEEGESFTSNNIDFLGVRIVDNLSSNESPEAFANNQVNGTEGVDVDDIAFFPWDIVNNSVEGISQGGEDDLISDGEVNLTDSNVIFQNIGSIISETVTETSEGLDLSRLDLDLDGAISPVDAVRVVNRAGYQLNPSIIEGEIV